jgi:hypothetical protein
MNFNVASLNTSASPNNQAKKTATATTVVVSPKFGTFRIRIMDLHEGLGTRDEIGVRRA